LGLSSRLIAAALVVGASSGRTQEPPIFSASADRVVIDLVATDREGRLVEDLRQDEIEVYEDGRLRQLEVMRLVGRDSQPGVTSALRDSTGSDLSIG
jgi:hypothetical protein